MTFHLPSPGRTETQIEHSTACIAGVVEPGRDNTQDNIDATAGPEPSQRFPEPRANANESW
jgi:hypothetical protein